MGKSYLTWHLYLRGPERNYRTFNGWWSCGRKRPRWHLLETNDFEHLDAGETNAIRGSLLFFIWWTRDPAVYWCFAGVRLSEIRLDRENKTFPSGDTLSRVVKFLHLSDFDIFDIFFILILLIERSPVI